MRRVYLTHPRFQFSFTLSFALGVALIFILIGGFSVLSLHLLAQEPLLSAEQRFFLANQSTSLVWFTLKMGVPITILFTLLGFYLSYKFVGPLYRLEAWLELHLLEKKPSVLKLRPGDELEPLVQALDRTIEKQKPSKKFR